MTDTNKITQRPVRLRNLLNQDRNVDRLAPDRDVERVRHGVRHQIIDHLGEPIGGVPDVADLALDVVVERAGGGDHLLQYLGAAEDHAERIFQIVGDGAEDLALEGIGLSQPRPLRGQSAVGGGEILSARSDAVLEPSIRALELLVKDDVVECDGKAAAENLDQRAVGAGEMTCRLQHDHDFAPAQRLDVKHRPTRRKPVMAAGECLFDQVS